MDKRLQILERLYGEPESEGQPDGDDVDVRREYQALRQVKSLLDHRKRQRPEPATVDRIVAAAAAASRGQLPTGVRTDRSPLRLLRATQLRVAVAAVVSVVIVGVGLWRMDLLPDRPTEHVLTEPLAQEVPGERQAKAMADAENEEFSAADEDRDGPDAGAALANARPGAAGVGSDYEGALAEDVAEPAEVSGELVARRSAAAPMPNSMIELDMLAAKDDVEERSGRRDSALMGDKNAPAAVLVGAAREVTESESAIPEWDETDDVIRLRQRLEQLHGRQANLAWDKPVVPLEMMPRGSDPRSRIHQAGASEQR